MEVANPVAAIDVDLPGERLAYCVRLRRLFKDCYLIAALTNSRDENSEKVPAYLVEFI